MKRKPLLSLMLLCLAFFGVARADVVEIGSGTSGTTYLPTYSLYNYSLTQQIYTACEIGTAGTINSIAFNNVGSVKTRTLDVYFVLTNKDAFTSKTDWIPVTAADLVYSGSVAFAANAWTTITLDTPFVLDGTNNLAVIVDDNSGTWSGGLNCAGFSAANMALRVYADGTNFNPLSPPTSYANNEYADIMSVKNCIKLDITPDPSVTLCCPPDAITVPTEGITAHEAVVNWEGGTAPYNVEYKKTTDTEWTVGATGVTGLTTTLSGLTQNTAYQARVQSGCGGAWKTSSNFTTLVSVLAPTALACTGTTSTTATLVWKENGTATNWILAYKTAADANFTEIPVSSDTTYTITGLTQSTSYQAKVCAVVNGESSSWSNAISFATDCGAFSDLPWNENFDSYTTGISTSSSTPSNYPNVTLPLCWQFLNRSQSSSTYPQAFLSSASGYAVTGNCLFFKSKKNASIYAILPEFTDDIADLYLTFTYRNEGTGAYNGTLYVGYMTNPADSTSFTVVDTCAQTTTKTEKSCLFEGAPAGSYMAFMYKGGTGSNYYLSIDNVIVTVPPTCYKPTGLAVSNVTNHTATLSWTENGEATAWQICINNDEAHLIDADTLSFTLTGLDPVTQYTAKVRANCGGSDGVSDWSNTVTFTTAVACAAPTSLAYTELTYQSVKLNWTSQASEWDVQYIATATNDTNTIAVDEKPYILGHLAPETAYKVRVRSNCGGDDGVSAWTSVVSFTTKSTCAAPINLKCTASTTNSATLSWVEAGNSTEWELMYINPATHDTATLTVTSNPYTITGLAGGTGYTAKVRPTCAADAWSGSVTFYTAFNIPMVEAFTSSSAPGGWNRYTGLLNEVLAGTATLSSTTSGWNFTSNGVLDGYHAKGNIYGTSWKYWLVTPTVLMENNVELRFDLALTDYNSSDPIEDPTAQADDRFVVLISVNGGNWTILREWNDTGSPYVYSSISSTGEEVVYDLSSYAGQYINIAFYGESTESGGDNDMHIDNVSINYIPSCEKPTNLTAEIDPRDATHAFLSWTPGGNETQWVVTYMTATDTVVGEPINTNDHYELTGLTPETNYTAMVQAYCGPGDLSVYSAPVSFQPTTAIVIGQASTSTGYLPANLYFYNSLTQQIYTVEELGEPGMIDRLGFFCNTDDPYTRVIDIYMVETAKDTLASASDWMTITSANLVYHNDAVHITQGWNDFELTNSFVYYGTSNVAIIFDAHSTDYQNGITFTAYNAKKQAIYAYLDGTDFDPMNPPTTSGNNLNLSNVKNQIRIVKSEIPSCFMPTGLSVPDSTLAITSAVLNWRGDAPEYNVRYRKAPYEVPASDAFVEDFESGDLTTKGWTTIRNGEGTTYTDWRVVNSETAFSNESIPAHSGSYVAMSRSYSGGSYDVDNWLISPQVTLNDNLTYWVMDDGIYHEHYDVYVSTTDTEIGSFTKVYEPGNASSTWTMHIVSLSAYAGQRGYIAFRNTDEDQDFLFIDDVVIGSVTIPAGEWITTPEPVTGSSLLVESLEAETEYEWQVQAVCAVDDLSDWASSTFTTLDACAVPFGLDTVSVASNSATLEWSGYQTSYNLRYRVKGITDVLFEDNFDDGNASDWTQNDGGVYHWTDEYTDWFVILGNGSTETQYLITPDLDSVPEGYHVGFYHMGLDDEETITFKVGYSSTTADLTAFEWGEPVTALQYDYDWFDEVIPTGTKYIAIQSTSPTSDASLFIDEFYVYKVLVLEGEWQYANGVSSPYELTGLAAETVYEWQVQGESCGDDDWSILGEFETLEQPATTTTQTITLAAGWNWISAYVEAEDLLMQLEESLGDNGIMIKNVDYNTEYDEEWGWFGDLDEEGMTNEQMYMVKVSAACTAQMQGTPANPANHTITINPGWNWIGYPSTVEGLTLDVAFANYEATSGDKIKNSDIDTEYDEEWGWFGDLETLEPGTGYMFFNASNKVKELVFASSSAKSMAKTPKVNPNLLFNIQLNKLQPFSKASVKGEARSFQSVNKKFLEQNVK